MIMNDALISLLDLKNILLGATDLLDNDKNKRLPLDSVKVKNREMVLILHIKLYLFSKYVRN